MTEAIADLAVSPVPASVVAAFERSAGQPGSLVAPLLPVAISPPPGVRFLSRFLPSWLRQGLRGATTERVIVMIGLLVLGLGAVAVWLLFQG